MRDSDPEQAMPENPPALNIPRIVVQLSLLMILIHAARTWIVSPSTDYWIINVFAFVPGNYFIGSDRLVEPMSLFWSPVTYALLHGDWTHLLFNLFWLVAFGSAVARRFGTIRFIIFMLAASVVSALAMFASQLSSEAYVIGASGAVGGCIGAAVRFAIGSGFALGSGVSRPALSIVDTLRNRSTLTFIAFWMLLNWLLGAGIIPVGIEGNIAWEAHIGGFLCGWLGFSLFDRNSGRHQSL